MASANVSGSLLLLQELSRQRRGNYMLSATLKGLALHAADKPNGLTAPDYTYGWGLLNTEKAANVIINSDGSHLLDEKVLRQETTFTQKFMASGNGPLKVTICWTDPEAAPTEIHSRNINNTSPKLVNDLDIVLKEGFNTYLPWVLDPALPAQKARTGDNFRDNIEQIYVANTMKGRSYTLTVSHKRTLKNGQQPFALIVSGIEKSDCEQAAFLSPGPDTTLCAGQVLTLAANPGNNLTYEWFQNGTSIRKGSGRFLDVSKAGSYTVRVTAPGCNALSPPVAVRNSPLFADIAQKGKLLVCDGKGMDLSANTGLEYSYQWLLNGSALAGAIQPKHQAIQSGTYQVQISHKGCTAVSAGTQVEVTPVMVSLTPTSGAVICNGVPAMLSTPHQNEFTYNWYFNNNTISGANGANLQATNPGRYAVEVRHGSCQVRSADVLVQNISLAATITPPPTTQIAPGGSLQLKANYAFGNRYAWYRNNTLLPYETAPLLNATQAGTYKVSIENTGCRAESQPIVLREGDGNALITGYEMPVDTVTQVILYPNPARETLFLTLHAAGHVSDLQAELATLLGQTLLSQTPVPERNYFRAEFDLRNLPPGAYIIKVKAGKHILTRHFMKY
jgi:hypothetical protein